MKDFWAHAIVLFLVTFGLAACGGSDSGDPWDLDGANNGAANNGAENNGGTNNGTSNNGNQNNGGTNNGNVQAIRFELVNDSDHDIFAGTGAGGTGGACFTSEWLEVADSTGAHRLGESCGICNCTDRECDVCAQDCFLPSLGDFLVSPGERREFEWSGEFWQTDSANSCELPSLPAERTLRATFCWGTSFQEQTMSVEAYEPAGVRCETVEFDRLDSETVTLKVTNEDIEPEQTRFELKNVGPTTIYARPGTQCYGTFVELSAGMQSIDRSAGCGACFCRDVETSDTCGMPCPGPPCPAPVAEVFEVAPGESRVTAWSGWAYQNRTESGLSCVQPYVPHRRPLEATFCWSQTIDDSSGAAELVSPVCEVVEFSFGDDVVKEVAFAMSGG